MKKESWLLVANSSFARIFKFKKIESLEEVKNFEHPESRLRNSDLVSDKPGRDFESVGVTRHALEPKISPKRLEFITFAKHLADQLEESRKNEEFGDLYIAASPTLLGLLRQSLHPNTAKVVKGEIDKDITHLKPEEIAPHMPFFF